MNSQRFNGKNASDYIYFKEITPHYDALQSWLTTPFSGVNGVVLELGCGPGFTTEKILAANDKIRVVAIDNDPEMIKEAKKNIPERARFVCDDIFSFLKKNTKKFQGFASGFTLHNFPKSERGKLIQKIYDTLDEGAFFVNADKIAEDDEQEHQKNLAWNLEQFKLIEREDLREGWNEHYLLDETPEFLLREKEMVALLDGVGFKEIKKVFREKMEAVFVARK